jgi:beta-N-acetylhexosaminidase
LQSAAQIPLFISVDEEGGLVSRLGNNQDISVDKFPPMIEIGNGGDSQKAFDAGATLGRQMRALGFNLDFAPVVDVLTNPLNTIIRQKGRAFGIEPEIVCHMVPRFVEGMQEQGVSAVLKHFPGHGDTVADSHEERVWSYADGERLRTVELLPFRAGIQAGVDFVMAAHVSLPRLTGGDEPASMSKYLITNLLKGELGFKGVVITDDMYMDAVRKHYDAATAAVNSINAGIDMIIIKLFFEDTYNGVLDAVKAGKISEARLDDAVREILELKIKRGVIN